MLSLSDLGWIGTPRLRQYAFENAGFWPGLLDNWRPNFALQPYTMFLTYAIFHAGLAHLVVNMITLWSLGLAVLDRVKIRGFVVIYLLSTIGGAVGYALLASGLRPMVGASGALFGLAGALLAWMYVDRFTHQQGLLPVAQALCNERTVGLGNPSGRLRRGLDRRSPRRPACNGSHIPEPLGLTACPARSLPHRCRTGQNSLQPGDAPLFGCAKWGTSPLDPVKEGKR